MNALAQYLQAQIAQRGWDQKRLAHEAKVAQSTISNIFNNPSYGGPTRGVVGRIADALGVQQRTLLELAGYSIEESVTPEARASRIARMLVAMPRAQNIMGKLVQLPAEEQDVVLSLIEELHRRHLRPAGQSSRGSE